MRFQCPHCDEIVAIDDGECGQPVGCGGCGNVAVVPETRFSPGACLDDFIFHDVIGSGGMGLVYLAHQVTLDRVVALKIMKKEFAKNEAFIVDFVNEARAAARLNHPNIVQSYAVGEEDGIYFLAMEFVEGMTLKDILEERQRLSVDETLGIAAQVAKALDFAWQEQQLVHRDIKPDNIMLTTQGVAKLADLGLARAAHQLVDDDDEEVMGTPQYICPEQLLGQPMDVRGDIYSLGATCYHALTGKFPFEGDSAHEISRKHLQEELTPPIAIDDRIPAPVSWVIEKMMAKKLEERHADPAELARDFALLLRRESPVGYTGPAANAPPAEADAAAANDPASSAGRTRTRPKGSKKISVRKKATSIRTAVTPTAGVANAKQAPAKKAPAAPKSKKGGVLKLAVSLLVLALVGAAGFGVYARLQYQKYNFKNADAAKKFYLANAAARERQSYEQIQQLLGKAVAAKDKAAHLQALVKALADFAEKHGGSLFCRASAVSYREAFRVPGLAWHFAGPNIEKHGRRLAGEIPRALAARQEELTRELRRLRHEEEVRNVIEVNRARTATATTVDAAVAAFAAYVGERKKALAQRLAGFQSKTQEKEKKMLGEREELRPQVLGRTLEYEFADAVQLVSDLMAAKSAYTDATVAQIEALTDKKEAEARLQETAKELQRQHQGKFDEAEATRRLQAELVAQGIEKVRGELRAAAKGDAAVLKSRQDWLAQLAASIEAARAFYDKVANTQKKFGGERLPTGVKVPFSIPSGARMEVALIQRHDIHINIKKFNSKTQKLGVSESKKLPLRLLDVRFFIELAAKAEAKDGEDPALLKGAFLLYTGRIPPARTALEESEDERSKFLLGEVIEAAEPIWRRHVIDGRVKMLRDLVESKDTKRAKRLVDSLRRLLGGTPEYKAREEEIRAILDGE